MDKSIDKKRSKKGCLIPLAIWIIISLLIGYNVNKNPEKFDVSRIANKYIDVTAEEGQQIDIILNECGITKVKEFKGDELLNNAHSNGETGYRIAINNDVDNIILYLNADKSVHSLKYAGYDLYANGTVNATLQDYTLSSEEASNLMIMCQEKVKQVLKSPSTAKFPNILNWGFSKEKNIITVQGYVDAQNSFGSSIRSEFQFIIDNDSSKINSFVFDGKEMIK